MKNIKRSIVLFVVSMFCFVCFWGCSNTSGMIESDPNTSEIIESNSNKNNFIELRNWFESSGVMNNIININYQDEEVICKFSCESGTLGTLGYHKPICEVETKVNQEVSWVCISENSIEKIYHDYITILLLKKSNVVGYAVLEVDLREDMIYYQAKILNQELFENPLSETEANQLVAKIINEKGDNY